MEKSTKKLFTYLGNFKNTAGDAPDEIQVACMVQNYCDGYNASKLPELSHNLTKFANEIGLLESMPISAKEKQAGVEELKAKYLK